MQESIAKNIERVRKLKGLTQSQVAAKVGLTTAGYQKIESNSLKQLSVDNVAKIATALEVDLAELLGRELLTGFSGPGQEDAQRRADMLAGRLEGLERQYWAAEAKSVAYFRAMVNSNDLLRQLLDAFRQLQLSDPVALLKAESALEPYLAQKPPGQSIMAYLEGFLRESDKQVAEQLKKAVGGNGGALG